MTDEAKTHTQGEVEILIATSRVETMQCILNDSFNEHKEEDVVHFGKLYEADKEIMHKIEGIPLKMSEYSEKIKTDILIVSRNEFTSITEFKVFKTWIITGLLASGAVAAVISTLLNYVLTLIKIGGT